jgi:hypothetical protein
MATSSSIQAPVLPFSQEKKTTAELIADDHSLLEIDCELDCLFDRIQDELEETGEISPENKQLFDQFCEAFGEKVDRIGRFIRIMEARTAYCKTEAARLTARAKAAENKVEQTKALVLYYLQTREMTKMEGKQFTLRCQKNSQDSVRISDPELIPIHLQRVEARFDGDTWLRIINALPEDLRPIVAAGIQGMSPMNDAIKQAVAQKEPIEGVTVIRGHHIRVV